MSEIQNNEVEVQPAEYIQNELAATQQALKNTRLYGSLGVLAIAVWLLGIGQGFASNLQPEEAAKITKGLVATKLEEAQPQISEYLRTEIPAFIEGMPEMATSQFPEYRQQVEATLESHLASIAKNTSDELDHALDTYLNEHKDQFKTIILEGQDKNATNEVAASMREMFESYLTEPQEDGESIQFKLNESLAALNHVEKTVHHLAHAKKLTAQEKRMKRALACLFSTVRDNRDSVKLTELETWQSNITDTLTAKSK